MITRHTPKYKILFIADSKYSIKKVNELFEDLTKKYGCTIYEYEDINSKYFIDYEGRYYKAETVLCNIESGDQYVLYKELYGDYKLKLQYSSILNDEFTTFCPLVGHSISRNNKHSKLDGDVFKYNRVNEVHNTKDELYKAYRALNVARYQLFGTSEERKKLPKKTKIFAYDNMIKYIRVQIKALKESNK
jgi:hypothetical protein